LPLIPDDDDQSVSSQLGPLLQQTGLSNEDEKMDTTSEPENYGETNEEGKKYTMRKRKLSEKYITETESKKNELTDSQLKSILWKSYTNNLSAEVVTDIPDLPSTEVKNTMRFNDIVVTLKQCTITMQKWNCKNLLNSYKFGCWLNEALSKFQSERKYDKTLPASWDQWVKQNLPFTPQMCYEYRIFSQRFHEYPKIFNCGLPLYFFRGPQGQRIVNLLKENDTYSNLFKYIDEKKKDLNLILKKNMNLFLKKIMFRCKELKLIFEYDI
jgi:hypothetical protein